MPNLLIIILALPGLVLPPLPAPPPQAIVCSVTASLTASGVAETDASNVLSIPYAGGLSVEGRPVSPGQSTALPPRP